MKVVLAAEARADLLKIGDHVAQDSPAAARKLVGRLLDAARSIGQTPRAFAIVPGYEDSGVRRRVVGAYLIFYRPEPQQITVIHILHGAQDYEALLSEDDP